MTKNEILTVKDAVHKIQLSLLEGINNDNQLFAAGSLLSKSDYQDVVIERTIAMLCGYPLCSNSLKSERPWKGRYRISLKEHKVYDVQETYMYCSSGCLISSQAFSAGLPEERSSNLDSLKLNKVVNKFYSFSMDSAVNMGKDEELGFSELKIKEKTNIEAGEVSLDEWIGPSNAIDGYVPRKDQNFKTRLSKPNKGSKHADTMLDIAGFLSSDMSFTSVIITQDEYSISKTTHPVNSGKMKEIENVEEMHLDNNVKNVKKTRDIKPVTLKNVAKMDAESPIQNDTPRNSNDLHLRLESTSGDDVIKSSLRTSHSKKVARNVSWADQKNEDDSQTVSNFSGMEDYHVAGNSVVRKDAGKETLKFASEAVSEAKVNISPSHSVQGFSNVNPFDSDDSWYDTPPDGFTLSLSPFCSIYNSLFAWISSSSIAYIYGKEESSHEEYANVNGRKYPDQDVFEDGRSSEIKQTFSGYLSRALPGVVAKLGLPIPISILEQGMSRLLDTMSFIDPLPSLRMKQWQVVALLFVNALSVTRIPALTPYFMARKAEVLKFVEGEKISPEEYEIMKELIIPLSVEDDKERCNQNTFKSQD